MSRLVLALDVETSGQSATNVPAGPTRASLSGWPELRAWAEHLDDLQRAAIATENRARGFPDPDLFDAHIKAVRGALHSCALALRRCYRRSVSPDIRAWQEEHPGLGEHLVARLLGHLGHPVHAEPKHWEGTGEARKLVADAPRERAVSALWQFCGHGDPARKKAKGMTAEEAAGLGNPTLKMLVHLLAESCVLVKTKHAGRYGEVYDLRRIVTAARAHAAPCLRCGPSGKPAAAGSPWSKAHQHADAMRIVGKEILRDLWIAAKKEKRVGQAAHETHLPLVGSSRSIKTAKGGPPLLRGPELLRPPPLPIGPGDQSRSENHRRGVPGAPTNAAGPANGMAGTILDSPARHPLPKGVLLG